MKSTLLSMLFVAGAALASVPHSIQPPSAPPATATAPGVQPEDKDFVIDVRAIPVWATKPADRNAAMCYWTAIASISKDLSETVGKVGWDTLGHETDAAKLPQEFREAAKAISESGWGRTDVLVGASLSKCDFEVRYEAGIGALLPHLGRLRSLARVLRIEARDFLTQGKPDEAAANIAAMFRLAEHSTHDRILISSLVGAAISAAARGEADTLLASGKLTAAGRAKITQAVNSLLTTDPFLGKASIESERDIFLGWTRAQLAKGPKYRAVVLGLVSGGEGKQVDGALKTDPVMKMTDDEVDAAIAKAGTAYDETVKNWNAPDGEKQLIAISERVAKGNYGLIARIMFPSISRAHGSLTLEAGKTAKLAEQLKAEK